MKSSRNLLALMIILCVIATCKNSSKITSKIKERTGEFNASILTEHLYIPSVDQTNVNLEKITYLKKIGEINDGFTHEEINFFAKIDDLCIDKNDDLYVADSKLHKIFKFNKNQNFLFSFGQTGQGPGEFTGHLRIKAGNDKNLYVTDFGNMRFSIFSSNGDFIQHFPLPRGIYDYAVANSSKNIFLLSESGLHLIDCFNSSFNYLQSLLDEKYHHYFPVESPSKRMLPRTLTKPPSASEVIKILSKDDHLFVIVNNSQIVVSFNQHNDLVNLFRIDHPKFIKDYKNRLQSAKREDAWINCFGSVFFDNNENICFCYYNDSSSIPEIYRYQRNGRFVDIIRIKGCEIKSNRIIRACDSFGHYIGVDKDSTKISVYRIDNKKY
jgi:hypothetical protein